MRSIDIFVKHFGGNQSAAARALGLSQAHVWYWMRPGNDMPLKHINAAASIIGLRPIDLRPDIFGETGRSGAKLKRSEDL